MVPQWLRSLFEKWHRNAQQQEDVDPSMIWNSYTEYFFDDKPADVAPLTFDQAMVALMPRELPGPKFMHGGPRAELGLIAKAFHLGTEETFNIEWWLRKAEAQPAHYDGDVPHPHSRQERLYNMRKYNWADSGYWQGDTPVLAWCKALPTSYGLISAPYPPGRTALIWYCVYFPAMPAVGYEWGRKELYMNRCMAGEGFIDNDDFMGFGFGPPVDDPDSDKYHLWHCWHDYQFSYDAQTNPEVKMYAGSVSVPRVQFHMRECHKECNEQDKLNFRMGRYDELEIVEDVSGQFYNIDLFTRMQRKWAEWSLHMQSDGTFKHLPMLDEGTPILILPLYGPGFGGYRAEWDGCGILARASSLDAPDPEAYHESLMGPQYKVAVLEAQ